MTFRTLRFRVAQGERGMGMPELIVAMSLFAILMTLVLTTVVSFSRAMTQDTAANDSANIGAIGMNELTRVIRSGTTVPLPSSTTPLPVFVEAKRESVTLHAFIDTSAATPKPVKVRFAVEPSTRDLVETRWDAYPTPGNPSYWSFSATPSFERVVARKIIAPTAAERPLFSYYRINDTTKVEEQVPLSATGALTEAEKLRVVAVEVTMKVQADETERAAPVTIVNRVGLPNLGVSRLGIL
ncbi:type II secretion system protein [Salinibacterium sp. dk2585]|uniref:PilW family protein n=1 Tax=unclassified Salinibacterium TaxID=2632331 RepID=UPI0011C24673|nr:MULTISPECIES: type II secretion system protein [unclassified Salinibacterium]QEE60602.1 type II secretion system protein [Salinibacterium sp. dk2585]TXK55674.1 type II secretion system protein [Salinibacterium sp. dk5596]